MMEEPMNSTYLFPLKEFAQRKAIIHLLIASDVLSPISKSQHNAFEISKFEKEWREAIEPRIRDKVLALNLPKVLTEQMIEMASPIGMQIKRWKDRLNYHFGDETKEITLSHASNLLRWTRAGLIDYHKTAKELVCCDDLGVVLRYKLACMNCLKNDIPLLWDQLPRRQKLYFYNVVRDQKTPSPHLHFCWPHILKGKLSNLDYLLRTGDRRNLTNFNQWAFEQSAVEGNKMATEYFLKKLMPVEGRALMRTALEVHRKMSRCVTTSDEISEVFFYLLSVMSPQQRRQIFLGTQGVMNPYPGRDPYPGPLSVSCFLNWPWPDLFLENICNFWSLIPPPCYRGVYYAMFQAFKNLDSGLPKLFPELFVQSPHDFKKLFVELQCFNRSSNFLHLFLRSDDSEAIRVIFRNVDTEDVQKLFIFLFSDDNILAGKWRAVEACLRETKPPKNAVKILKEIYMDFALSSPRFEEDHKQKRKRFFEHLDGTGVSADQVTKAKKPKLVNCFVLIKNCPVPGDGE